jgi:hypothetical protein
VSSHALEGNVCRLDRSDDKRRGKGEEQEAMSLVTYAYAVRQRQQAEERLIEGDPYARDSAPQLLACIGSGHKVKRILTVTYRY